MSDPTGYNVGDRVHHTTIYKTGTVAGHFAGVTGRLVRVQWDGEPEPTEHGGIRPEALAPLALGDEERFTLCAGTYENGAPCAFFIDHNTAHDDSTPEYPIAEYVHLHRGDGADEALDDHEPIPGDSHPLVWWKQNGPERVRDRFVVTVEWTTTVVTTYRAEIPARDWERMQAGATTADELAEWEGDTARIITYAVTDRYAAEVTR